ncbi:hypothetical protein ncot_13575 [Nocardioides sp. JQ2195]|uniref:hypothetical protein n=1 Tax=Nocardioides sp. JQ2195 TaxID=2592334 RepID=UPI00143EDAC9|nr:hypothetical protein [Nocardioides sp. JQ2195]QIX27522.1 hypothetical protein ncot_13575 [Nocardioides sp. JQ2195]
MSRRVSLPAADDLFRPTADRSGTTADKAEKTPLAAVAEDAAVVPGESTTAAKEPRKPSGRIRHDEKMTVYVTSDELLDIEHARLTLRRTTGKAVDRGRLVRSAIAIALADLEQNGDDSVLVSRLRDS